MQCASMQCETVHRVSSCRVPALQYLVLQAEAAGEAGHTTMLYSTTRAAAASPNTAHNTRRTVLQPATHTGECGPTLSRTSHLTAAAACPAAASSPALRCAAARSTSANTTCGREGVSVV